MNRGKSRGPLASIPPSVSEVDTYLAPSALAPPHMRSSSADEEAELRMDALLADVCSAEHSIMYEAALQFRAAMLSGGGTEAYIYSISIHIYLDHDLYLSVYPACRCLLRRILDHVRGSATVPSRDAVGRW